MAFYSVVLFTRQGLAAQRTVNLLTGKTTVLQAANSCPGHRIFQVDSHRLYELQALQRGRGRHRRRRDRQESHVGVGGRVRKG